MRPARMTALALLLIILVSAVACGTGGEQGSTPTSTATQTSIPTPTPTLMPTNTPVGSVTVSIDAPATVKKSSSRYFHAQVNISAVTDLDAAQYDITYDPDVLRIQDITAGVVSGTTVPVEEWTFIPANTQGVVRITNSIPKAPGVDGEGYLADIYFKVMGDPGEFSPLSFVEGLGDPLGYLMINSNIGLEIHATWVDSTVTIE